MQTPLSAVSALLQQIQLKHYLRLLHSEPKTSSLNFSKLNQQNKRRREEAAQNQAFALRIQQLQFRERQQQMALMEREQRRRHAQLRIQAIQQREFERIREKSQAQQRYKQILHKEFLYHRLEEQFYSQVLEPSRLEQQQKINQRKARMVEPINHQSIKRHAIQFDRQRQFNRRVHQVEVREGIEHDIYRPNFKLQVAQQVRRQNQLKKLELRIKKEQGSTRLLKIKNYSEAILLKLRAMRELPSLQKSQPARSQLPEKSKREVINYLSRRSDQALEEYKRKKIEKMLKCCKDQRQSVQQVLEQMKRMDSQLTRQRCQSDVGLYVKSIQAKLDILKQL